MPILPYLMLGIPFAIILGIVGYALWLYQRRALTVRSIRANPTSVLHAWIEPPDETYSVSRLKIKTIRGSHVAAAHTEIPSVLRLLEQIGVRVY